MRAYSYIYIYLFTNTHTHIALNIIILLHFYRLLLYECEQLGMLHYL